MLLLSNLAYFAFNPTLLLASKLSILVTFIKFGYLHLSLYYF